MLLTAKFPGECCNCGRPILVGNRIEWLGPSRARCGECSKPQPAEPPRQGPPLLLDKRAIQRTP